jgi:hypothetical protein
MSYTRYPLGRSKWPGTKFVKQTVKCYNAGIKGEMLQSWYNSIQYSIIITIDNFGMVEHKYVIT